MGLARDPEVVIKETNGSHAADLVMAMLPVSRLLHLVRDGRDVVDSLLDAYKPGAFMANNQKQSFGTEELRATRMLWAARLWACNVDMTMRAIAAHPPELCRTVRYEDLLADPRRRGERHLSLDRDSTTTPHGFSEWWTPAPSRRSRRRTRDR